MKLYSKEDVNIDNRLGAIEDALNEVFDRLTDLEKKVKPAKKPRGKSSAK